MAEYIEREALFEAFENAEADVCEEYPDGYCDFGFGRKNVADIISGISAADVAPVVRCRDCKWYKEIKKMPPNKFCFRLRHPFKNERIGYNFMPDDFCSYGERKKSDDGY